MGKIIKNAKNKVMYRIVKTMAAMVNKSRLELRLDDCCDLVNKNPEVFYIECNDGKAKVKVYDYDEIVKNLKVMC